MASHICHKNKEEEWASTLHIHIANDSWRFINHYLTTAIFKQLLIQM